MRQKQYESPWGIKSWFKNPKKGKFGLTSLYFLSLVLGFMISRQGGGFILSFHPGLVRISSFLKKKKKKRKKKERKEEFV